MISFPLKNRVLELTNKKTLSKRAAQKKSFVTLYRNYLVAQLPSTFCNTLFYDLSILKKWKSGQTPGPLKYCFSSGNTECLGNTKYLLLKSSSIFYLNLQVFFYILNFLIPIWLVIIHFLWWHIAIQRLKQAEGTVKEELFYLKSLM